MAVQMDWNAFAATGPSKSERARSRLMRAAVEKFGDRGLEGATLRDIAKAAGQNVASIAYYFGGKRGLYRAVLEGLAREMRSRMGDYLERVRRKREGGRVTREEAAVLLKEMLLALFSRVLSRTETIPFVRLVAREQLKPTADFKVLYDQAFMHLHGAFSFLTGTVLGLKPEEQETILRTHMLLGQVFFFAFSRGVILRRLDWKDLEGANTEVVVRLLAEHLDVLLTELPKRRK